MLTVLADSTISVDAQSDVLWHGIPEGPEVVLSASKQLQNHCTIDSAVYRAYYLSQLHAYIDSTRRFDQFAFP